MTWHAALDHTPEQLVAVERAAGRIDAERRLGRLIDTNRAFAGGKDYTRLAHQLLRQLEQKD